MKILLAVSGGIDSMYLAHKAPELFPGASFAVAHCNFCLRGEESDGDEAFVREYCASSGLKFFSQRFDTASYATEHGISIEMAARDLRYAWFAKLCASEGFDAVAVAHNADDNAETLILNLLRGTGTKGMRGMRADVANGRGVRILRPLLGVSREDITSWMTSRHLPWREDSSNASAEYKRNRVRAKVFPVFRELNPSFLETLAADMANAAQVDVIAEDYYQSVISTVLHKDAVEIAALLKLKHWRYVLYRILDPYGFSSGTVLALTELLERSSDAGTTLSGKAFEAPGYVAVTSASQIRILPRTSGTLDETPGKVQKVRTIVYDKPEGFDPVRKDGTLVADADKLPLPLKIRGWHSGDWMVPLGMKGRKKLSDLFVDLKWDFLQKQSALVVEHPDGKPGHVAALLCVRIDDDLKVTASTTRILEIS